MAPNKHLNVLTEEDVIPAYAGMVNGMCFLGIYVPNDDGKTMNTGIYNTDFENGQSVDSDTANLLKIAGTYSASYFTEQTGLEAKCNALSECYVKQDSSWIPYKVWVLQQQENKVQLTDSNK
jgi:hypothetical protein